MIERLNSLKIKQTSSWQEDIPEDVWKECIEGNLVARGLDVDKHRWYETIIDVFKCGEEFIGVRHVGMTYSEMQDIDSLDWQLEFFEMEKIHTVTYKPMI